MGFEPSNLNGSHPISVREPNITSNIFGTHSVDKEMSELGTQTSSRSMVEGRPRNNEKTTEECWKEVMDKLQKDRKLGQDNGKLKVQRRYVMTY